MSFVPYATKGEAILCEKHSAMAKAYWSKANLPAPY